MKKSFDFMISQYNPQRTKNIFNPNDDKPYKLSRSRIDAYLKCKRCFYIDRKYGTEQPPMYPYTLNNAVDSLLKKEFDFYRGTQTKHPLLIEQNINATPFAHKELNDWRMNQRGIKYLHESTNFMVYGAIDDLWIQPNGELIIVDYKATSTLAEIDIETRPSYKRQIEIYQWLFRQNGFKVSSTAYFVYCNGDASKDGFGAQLQFNISILPYIGDDSWVETTLVEIKNCLMQTALPETSANCDYCKYLNAIMKHINFMAQE